MNNPRVQFPSTIQNSDFDCNLSLFKGKIKKKYTTKYRPKVDVVFLRVDGFDFSNLNGKNILVVDDVSTTGSTAAHLTDLLRKDGANVVELYSLACGSGHDSGLNSNVINDISNYGYSDRKVGELSGYKGNIGEGIIGEVADGKQTNIRRNEKTYSNGREVERKTGTEKSTETRRSIQVDSIGRELSDGQREYFKDSMAVDEQGRLVTLYHGTQNGGFSVFKDGYIYLTDNKDVARSYTSWGTNEEIISGSQMTEGSYKVYANITNPFVIDAKGSSYNEINFRGKKYTVEALAKATKKLAMMG